MDVTSRTLLLVLALLAGSGAHVIAQRPVEYRSKNFVIRTDLSKDQAEALLAKLETMLGLISKYWAVPNRQPLECYVVSDLKNWPANSIDPRAMPSLQAKAGITLSQTRRIGNRTAVRAVAYATASKTITQHEAVHSYCYMAFGTCGPQWYAEGMAEMGAMWIEGETRVTAPRYRTEFLRNSKRRSIKDITEGEVGRIGSWQTYSWRWALCHLLANNKNYSQRFRPMGLAMLSGKRGLFRSTYGKQLKELEFEYNFFVDHIQPGFDVAACSWDWDTRFRKLRPGKIKKTIVRANRGWQATGIEVEAGQKYKIETEGTWRVEKDGTELSVTGDKNAKHGVLEAVTLARYKLAPPFAIGDDDTFTAKESGDLQLRCRDSWGGISDNQGEIVVSVSRAHSD